MSDLTLDLEYLEYVTDFAKALERLGWSDIWFRQRLPNAHRARHERPHAYRSIGWAADGDYGPHGRHCELTVQREYDGTVSAASAEVSAVGVCPQSAALALAERLEVYAADLRAFAEDGVPD